jgi:hypothetical protein
LHVRKSLNDWNLEKKNAMDYLLVVRTDILDLMKEEVSFKISPHQYNSVHNHHHWHHPPPPCLLIAFYSLLLFFVAN